MIDVSMPAFELHLHDPIAPREEGGDRQSKIELFETIRYLGIIQKNFMRRLNSFAPENLILVNHKPGQICVSIW
ncbi:MAG: hypothetical protein C0606_06240 [Hyphomicrobiales bacterium]|nr:MAG: hypothetical protein C0606_06240 [Hyphomicrobiales bacterium]